MNAQDSHKWTDDPEAGARNLLENCVGLKSGETVLFVREDSAFGRYDDAPGDITVKIAADEIGAKAFEMWTPLSMGPGKFPKPLAAAMQQVDHTVFFSRIGDQVRFNDTPGRSTVTMTYALSLDQLGSPFCTVPHQLIERLAEKLRIKFAAGGEWRITCPLGTDLRGHIPAVPLEEKDPNAFTVNLFPLGILAPSPADNMAGQAATKWLQSTQNNEYEPEGLVLEEPAILEIEKGRIRNITGRQDVAAAVNAHYDHVASLFGLDRNFVHSWHTGLHPKTFTRTKPSEDIGRWGVVAFNSPRYTHLHTCGDYPPGEISVDIIDASISLDGEMLWDKGKFLFLDNPDVQDILSDFPGHEDAFKQVWEIGL